MNGSRSQSGIISSCISLFFGVILSISPIDTFGQIAGKDLEAVSDVEIIFNFYYPGLECSDAPTLLNNAGIRVLYKVARLPFNDDVAVEWSGSSVRERPQGKRIKTFLMPKDARHLLKISGLNMSDILKFEDLLARGRDEELRAILSGLIEPKMDKYNRRDLMGYDPELCINDDRNHVYQLRLGQDYVEEIRNLSRLLHSEKTREYRSRLLEYLPAHPKYSELYVGIGNSFFVEGNIEQARQWYQRGLVVNSLNPMLEYSLAFCSLMEGDSEGAIASLKRSMLTCRNNMLVWIALEELLSLKGGRIIDLRFRNRTLVNINQAVITIGKGVSPGVHLPWIYYGAAEIASEHERTRARGGFEGWGLEAIEMYRIVHLMVKYMLDKNEDPGLYDPVLESLVRIHERGLLKEYILLERIAPYSRSFAAHMLDGDELSSMEEYLNRFVALGR